MNAQVQYGLPTLRGMPYGRFQITLGGARAFGTGMRYELTRVRSTCASRAPRSESAPGQARHRFALRGHWRF